jgi:protoheme ferro-lyase
MSQSDVVKQVNDLVDNLSEDDKSAVISHLSTHVFIPMWFTKEYLETLYDVDSMTDEVYADIRDNESQSDYLIRMIEEELQEQKFVKVPETNDNIDK